MHKTNVGAMMGCLSIRNLVSFSDLSEQDLELVLDTAEQMAEAIGFGGKGEPSLAQPLDRILGTAFFEPSTRTRLSFEAAMLRLGGQTLGFAEATSTSAAKGESVADTVQIMSAYCDIIVMRHPLAGAAKVAAGAAEVPFINGGDGAREHPTQTLTDLFCIRREFGTLSGLKVGLCGDLKYGRTVHSLAPVMAQMGSEIVCIAPELLKMPERYLAEVEGVSGSRPCETEALEEVIGELDVLYMTRIQSERFEKEERKKCEQVAGVYVLTPEMMAGAKEEMRVLHPLPRVEEISVAVDADPRAAYFRQAAGGVPVRMALIALLLELPQFQPAAKGIGLGKPARATKAEEEVIAPRPEPTVASVAGCCRNEKCITNSENEPVEAEFIQAADGRIICAYCEQEQDKE